MKNVKSDHTRPIVCLDAGHYAKYNRSPVVPAYYESEMNWKLAHLLDAELYKYGIEVRHTRADPNKDMELTDRGKASAGADLFISLHSNAADSESVRYVVAMFQVDDDCGKMDEQSREVAGILAETVGNVMNLPWQTWSTKSSSDRDGNGYKDDYYGVLRGAHTVHTAGVIIEHGFHTHTATAKWLLVDANLQKLAEAEAKAIAEWFDLKQTAEPTIPKPATFTLTLPMLRQGDKGETVRAMQILLVGRGEDLPKYGADGDFGAETTKAVKYLQADNDLDADGICGPMTWSKLLGV